MPTPLRRLLSAPLRLLTLLVAVALLAAACASGDDRSDADIDDEGDTAAETTVAPADDGATVEESADPAGEWGRRPVVLGRDTPSPTELVTTDLIVGDGPEAMAGDTVLVHYVGVRYEDGVQFDASWDRAQPFQFVLGAGQVIQGWERGVEGMTVGTRRELIIPADLAYGDRGAGADIPPGQTLIFVVDLLDLAPAPPLWPEPFENSAEGVSVPNQGGDFEGTALSGSFGASRVLLIGDEFNPNLPEGEGLEVWLAFGLQEVTDTLAANDLSQVTLRSQTLQAVDGDPFTDLGSLSVQVVPNQSFPPDDEARASESTAAPCDADVEAGGLTCDVSEIVAEAIAAGTDEISFRIRFDTPSDGDGAVDAIYFFISDPTANESGNFTLEFEPPAG